MDTNPAYTGRLAPAPTGALHLGNARTFLVAWLRARLAGGRLILRLEDLDHPKVKPGTASEVYRDLSWLGLNWDSGPVESFPQPVPPGVDASDSYVQSKNLPLYTNALDALKAAGRVYPCVCSRRDIEQIQSAPNALEEFRERAYPGTCRGRFDTVDAARSALGGGDPALRFMIGKENTTFDDGYMGLRGGRLREWSGDFAVARGDRVSYQLAVVVDDAAMGVTEVVRGDDLAPSTERQLALYRALGLAIPRFYHVPLVVGPDGRRLAKRHADSRISRIRERGGGPERLLGWLAWSLDWLEEPCETSIGEIMAMANFAAMPQKPIVLVADALAWLGI